MVVFAGDDADGAGPDPTPLPAVEAIRIRNYKLVAGNALEDGGSVPVTSWLVSFPYLTKPKRKIIINVLVVEAEEKKRDQMADNVVNQTRVRSFSHDIRLRRPEFSGCSACDQVGGIGSREIKSSGERGLSSHHRM